MAQLRSLPIVPAAETRGRQAAISAKAQAGLVKFGVGPPDLAEEVAMRQRAADLLNSRGSRLSPHGSHLRTGINANVAFRRANRQIGRCCGPSRLLKAV